MAKYLSLFLIVISVATNTLFAQVGSGTSTNKGLDFIQVVPVGDITTVGDNENGDLGDVPYLYCIGTYDVTAWQYCTFLNHIAAADWDNLYNTNMGPNEVLNNDGTVQTNTGDPAVACIGRSGRLGTYYYYVLPGRENFPITYVNYGAAARFCNWMQNGQPKGEEQLGTTDSGSYSIQPTTQGGTSVAPLNVITNAGQWKIPNRDEWYKAAYNNGPNGYLYYPTCFNAAPGNSTDPALTNNANYATVTTVSSQVTNVTSFLGHTTTNVTTQNVTTTNYATGMAPYLTPVGTFKASPGPYGTYDMGGDVAQWTDTQDYSDFIPSLADPTKLAANSVYVLGGSWKSTDVRFLAKTSCSGAIAAFDWNLQSNTVGFRVAYVPPPLTASEIEQAWQELGAGGNYDNAPNAAFSIFQGWLAMSVAKALLVKGAPDITQVLAQIIQRMGNMGRLTTQLQTLAREEAPTSQTYLIAENAEASAGASPYLTAETLLNPELTVATLEAALAAETSAVGSLTEMAASGTLVADTFGVCSFAMLGTAALPVLAVGGVAACLYFFSPLTAVSGSIGIVDHAGMDLYNLGRALIGVPATAGESTTYAIGSTVAGAVRTGITTAAKAVAEWLF